MKVVHIVRGHFHPNSLDGVYKVVDSLSQAFASKGIDVTVCSVARHHGELFIPDFYRHIQVAESRIRFLLTRLFKAFLEEQPRDTVFHFHSVFIPWFLPAIKFLKHRGFHNIVLTPHGQYIDTAMQISLKKRVFFHLFDAKVIRLVSFVHLIGKSEMNSYVLKYAQRCVLIPNACYPKILPSVASRELVFGYMGRLEIEQKGVDMLVASFLAYKSRGGGGVLRIAGEGADKAHLVAMVRESTFPGSVSFVGVVYDEQKWAFLRSCAFFCHFSRWDVFPTSVLEAASVGIPLLLTNATNMELLVDKYGAGRVLDAATHRFADAMFEMEAIFHDKDKYETMCTNANRMVREELNWDAIAEGMLSEYRKL